MAHLQTPLALNLWWNLGRLLGMLMSIQFISGWLLTFIYINSTSIRFNAIWTAHLENPHIRWIHWIHFNFASFIFFFIYLHIFKAIYYQCWKTRPNVWYTGVVILILTMAIAFIGYVLPFGQISLWGATVITNLLSVIRNQLVIWVWAGYRVNEATLNFFFTLHYSLPAVLIIMIILHLFMLHLDGRRRHLSASIKVKFHPYYVWKDMLNIVVLLILFWWVAAHTYATADIENFSPANRMVSPLHIQPEWYFLQYYAVLRRIPNKVAGIICFATALLLLLYMAIIPTDYELGFLYPRWRMYARMFATINIALAVLGAQEVAEPFLTRRVIFTTLYILWFTLLVAIEVVKAEY